MSAELEQRVTDALSKQASIWAKIMVGIIGQTVIICAFLFGLKADINGNTKSIDRNRDELAYNKIRTEKLEDNQKELIRLAFALESLAKDMTQVNKKLQELEEKIK